MAFVDNLRVYVNWNSTYTNKQSSRVSWLPLTGFAAFDKGVQLISAPPPYDENEQLSG